MLTGRLSGRLVLAVPGAVLVCGEGDCYLFDSVVVRTHIVIWSFKPLDRGASSAYNEVRQCLSTVRKRSAYARTPELRPDLC